jgi:hypothetical protein
MAFKFDWKRLLIITGLSALSHLMEELSSGVDTPKPEPNKIDSTIKGVGPDGFPLKKGTDFESDFQSRL